MRFRVVARNDKGNGCSPPSLFPCNPSNNATLNQLCIQAHSSSLRCGGSFCKVQGDNTSQSVQLCDTGSHLDYSGCRKTHRFPPPYGLGSHSLTHRPTENPTGMTKKQPPHSIHLNIQKGICLIKQMPF